MANVAIDAAERTIYIENQAFESPEIVHGLDTALRRGVDVVVLLPAEVEDAVREARLAPSAGPFFEAMGALGRHSNFTMAGLGVQRPDGQPESIYVHAKLMLVDDCFATIGSCNLRARSFFRHTELNVSFLDPTVVHGLRCALLLEHLAQDTSDLDDQAALRLFAETARTNAASTAKWQGIAFALDPKTYGT